MQRKINMIFMNFFLQNSPVVFKLRKKKLIAFISVCDIMLICKLLPTEEYLNYGKKSTVCGDGASGRQPIPDRHPFAL
jgi:hypothetical protein